MGADIQWHRTNGTIQPQAADAGSTDASERRRLVDELEERLRFETLLADLSARFINLSADHVKEAVEAMLGRIVEFLGLERATIFQVSEDETIMQVSHCWAAPGFESLEELIPRDVFPWALARVLQGNTVFYSSVDELPEEAAGDKATVRRVGPKSSITFPLTDGAGEAFGALAFGQMSRERAWPDNLIQRLRLVSQMLANALLRCRSDHRLGMALAEIKQLKERLVQDNVYRRQEASLLRSHEHLIGQSPALKKAFAQAEQVAGTEATVLLLGETGTGKERMATAIHNLSSRRERAMVKVNCAALPASLVESELFGREKGAYTGALSKQIGRFELAHGSTIFLDEVGDLPLEVQVKLLRVLQEGQLEHLGSPKPIHVDVRVIAATNRDIIQLVRQGRFREDLFYRLNVFPITVPPLRERRQDIPLLVWAFVEEFSKALGKTIRAIAKESMEALERHSWPGNIRELRNVIERAMITSTGTTLWVAAPGAADSTASKSMIMADVEREHIVRSLELSHWRIRGKDGAAAMLGLKPTTLEARIARLGIQRPGKESNIS